MTVTLRVRMLREKVAKERAFEGDSGQLYSLLIEHRPIRKTAIFFFLFFIENLCPLLAHPYLVCLFLTVFSLPQRIVASATAFFADQRSVSSNWIRTLASSLYRNLVQTFSFCCCFFFRSSVSFRFLVASVHVLLSNSMRRILVCNFFLHSLYC